MPRSVDIALAAKDNASPAFQSAGASWTQLREQFGATRELFQGVATDFKGLTEAVKSLGSFSVSMTEGAKEAEGFGAAIFGVTGTIYEIAKIADVAESKISKLVAALKNGSTGAKLGVLGAIAAGVYASGRAIINANEESAKELEEFDKAQQKRQHVFGKNETRESVDARTKATSEALLAANEKDANWNGGGYIAFAKRMIFPIAAINARRQLISAQEEARRVVEQSKRFDETGRVTVEKEETKGGFFNRKVGELAKGLADKTKIDLAPLNHFVQDAQAGFANFKRQLAPFKKDAEEAAQIRKDSRAPMEVYKDQLKEIDRLKGFLGKEGVGKAQREARLKLANDLGLEADSDKEKGPTKFDATQSRFLRTGQGFEDPATKHAKRAADAAEKQVELLEKVQEILDDDARKNAGAMFLKALPR